MSAHNNARSKRQLIPAPGEDLDKARRMFERIVRARPRIQLTVRQRTRVLDEWPPPGHR